MSVTFSLRIVCPLQEYDRVLATRGGAYVREFSPPRATEDSPDEDDESPHSVHIQAAGNLEIFIQR